MTKEICKLVTLKSNGLLKIKIKKLKCNNLFFSIFGVAVCSRHVHSGHEVHIGCLPHFPYLCILSPVLYASIQFFFSMSRHIFLSGLQTPWIGTDIHTLSCCDNNQSHSWDMSWLCCSECTVGYNVHVLINATAFILGSRHSQAPCPFHSGLL